MGRKLKFIPAIMLSVLLAFSAAAERRLIPGGQLVGVSVNADGLIYVGASDLGAQKSPARLAGLKSGDIIRKINGQAFDGVSGFSRLMKTDRQNTLDVERGGEMLTVTVTPDVDPRDGKAKIGAWVRENVAGIGTLTFIDPATGQYAALGHGISDPDAGVNVPVSDGVLFRSDLTDVIPGKKGVPGELQGEFFQKNEPVGTISQNLSSGIYGTYVSSNLTELPYPQGLPIGEKDRVHTGKAMILSTVNRNGPAQYEIEILQTDDSEKERNILFKVTDESLLNTTGGIVQGMSGSPIIQDGKLIGAVTHVLVNDPTRGYGIFIENMLEAAG